jgi:zinc protease
LTLAGDIAVDRALELAEQYFGEIPRGPAPPPVLAASPAIASRSLLLEDRVELPRLYLSWHSPPMFAPDDAELDLAADVLAHGKTSRLYRQLVYERRVATDVSAYQHSRELSGLFQVACTAAAGVALPVLEQATMDAVQSLAADGPTADELARAEAQTEAQFVYRLQTVGGFGGKSDQLNAYNVFKQNPGFFDADLARYQSVTGAGMASAVRRWLVGQPRVALSVVPRGERALALSDAIEVQVS